ncbi:hypothetical protein YC2023_020531 [Brassica napus]
MTDAGNFRLLSKDSSKDLWSSFDNPTDTLLPLRVPAATTKSLDVGRNLSSRRTETDFGKGKFRLHLGLDGNLQLLVLNSNSLSDSDVYFHYYESRTKEPNPGTRLVFNRSGYMYVLLSSKQQLNAYSQQGSSRLSTITPRGVLNVGGDWIVGLSLSQRILLEVVFNKVVWTIFRWDFRRRRLSERPDFRARCIQKSNMINNIIVINNTTIFKGDIFNLTFDMKFGGNSTKLTGDPKK